MKITVQTPLHNEQIKALLDGLDRDGAQFTFLEKKGIGLVFEVRGEHAENGCDIAKREIKATDWGKVLYFSVQAR